MKRLFFLSLILTIALSQTLVFALPNTWHMSESLVSESFNGLLGCTFTLNSDNVRIDYIKIFETSDVDMCLIFNETDNSLVGAWTTNASNVCLPDVYLANTSTYKFVANHDGTGAYYQHTTTNFPYTSVDISETKAWLSSNNGTTWTDVGTTTTWDLIEIGTANSTLPPSEYTETKLFLNYNETNITIDNITTLNSTSLINASVWVAIDINGTLSANDTATSFNLTNLSVGLWNITAYFNGDNSYNSSQVIYWVNITEYTLPAIPLNITNYTYTICTDNSTLYNHDYYFANGSLVINDRSTYCPYGCDNTSFNCNLTPLETGFYSFLIILGIVIFILFFDRYILRGRN